VATNSNGIDMSQVYSPITYDLQYFYEVLYQRRHPKFLLEHEIAAIMLPVWILCKDMKDFMDAAPLFIAARLSGQIPDPELKAAFIQSLSDRVAFPDLLGQYAQSIPFYNSLYDMWERSYATPGVFHIVDYFVIAPADPADEKFIPSLNKALHFIDASGYGDETKISVSTLKDAWTQLRETAPFIYADELSGLDLTLIDLEEHDLFAKAKEILADKEHLELYFGTAKHAQRILDTRLNKISRDRFKFPAFPDDIEEAEIEFDPMTDEQLKIIGSYRAPKSI
jgi:hypothetical protein